MDGFSATLQTMIACLSKEMYWMNFTEADGNTILNLSFADSIRVIVFFRISFFGLKKV